MRAPAVYVVAALTVLVLGANWPIMSLGVESIPPLWLSTLRLLGAGLLLGCAMALANRLHVPPRADLPVVLSVGLVRLGLVWALMFPALTMVPPGRSSVLIYTSSLWTAPLAAYFLREPLPALRVAGVVLGVAGVVVMVQPWGLDFGEGGTAVGYGMLVAAAIASAAGTVHIRGHRWTSGPIDLLPWQLALGGLFTGVLALVVEGTPSFSWTLREILIVAYQILPASAFGFWGVMTLARSLPATSTNLLLMAVPAVGVTASVLFVGEQLTTVLGIATALIFGGVTCGIVADQRARRARVTS